jgi:hypothetical protein
MIIVILGVLAGIVIFAVQTLSTSSTQASCGTDFKTVQTAAEDYKAEMGSYPNGSVTDTLLPTTPSPTVGSSPGPSADDASALLLTGSEVSGTGKDSLGNPTLNKASETGDPVGPWLKDLPGNPRHYSMYLSNDGVGTILVVDGNGNVVGPAGGNGGNGVSDCNDLP